MDLRFREYRRASVGETILQTRYRILCCHLAQPAAAKSQPRQETAENHPVQEHAAPSALPELPLPRLQDPESQDEVRCRMGDDGGPQALTQIECAIDEPGECAY